MNRIFDLAINDIVQVLRDRLSFLFLLIMPVAFTLMFAFAFGGLGGQAKSAPSPALGVLDQDRTPASTGLLALLKQPGSGVNTQPVESETDLYARVASGKLAAGLTIPKGYGAALASTLSAAGQGPTLKVITPPTGSAGITARGAIETAARRVDSASTGARSFSAEVGYPLFLNQALAAWQTAPVRLEVASITTGEKSGNTMPVQQTAPAMMLQFGMAGLITAAQVVVSERKSCCLRRLLTTPIRRWQILFGHYLAMFSIIFGQFILLIVFGQVVLGLDYLRQPLATLVMALSSALFIAGLGLLVGALAKTDEQAILFSMIPMFLFSALGGAWVPLESTGRAFQFAGHLTPVAWAMDGFQAIVSRGLGLGAVGLPAAILLGYAILFGGLAVWRFQFVS